MASLCRVALFVLISSVHGTLTADVKIAIDTRYLPYKSYVFEDFQEAYRRAGEEVTIDFLPGRRAIAMANAGTYQALDARYLGGDSLNNLIPVMVPIYWEFEVYAYGLASTDIFLQSQDDLHQYQVVAVRGNTFNLALKKKVPNINLVPDEVIAARMVGSGRADIALITTESVARLTAGGVVSNMEKKSDLIFHKRLYHHIHNSRAALLPKLEKVMKAMKKEGKFSVRW